MKRAIFPICMFILLLSVVSAGKIYDIDFSESPTQIVTLNERDMIRFNFPVRVYEDRVYSTLEEKRNSPYKIKNFEEKLMIKGVDEEDGMVKLAFFIHDVKVPQYFALTKKTMIKTDFERDNIDDLFIGLDKIEGKKVSLILQKVSLKSKEDTSKITGYITKIYGGFKENNTIYYIIGAIIILFLILKQKKIREYFSSEE